MQSNWFDRLRIGLGVLATALALCGLWLLAAALIQPKLPYFAADRNDAEVFGAAQGRATTAASLGMVRGDLSTDAALTHALPLLLQSERKDGIDRARDATRYAAERSPHDARLWLVLAGLETRTAGDAAEALKLSYYTGPNELALAPLRLSVAARIAADEELRSLVQSEIERIVLGRPDLKPAIAAAYRGAGPEGRQLIEATLELADPAYLGTLMGEARPQ